MKQKLSSYIIKSIALDKRYDHESESLYNTGLLIITTEDSRSFVVDKMRFSHLKVGQQIDVYIDDME